MEFLDPQLAAAAAAETAPGGPELNQSRREAGVGSDATAAAAATAAVYAALVLLWRQLRRSEEHISSHRAKREDALNQKFDHEQSSARHELPGSVSVSLFYSRAEGNKAVPVRPDEGGVGSKDPASGVHADAHTDAHADAAPASLASLLGHARWSTCFPAAASSTSVSGEEGGILLFQEVGYLAAEDDDDNDDNNDVDMFVVFVSSVPCLVVCKVNMIINTFLFHFAS